MKKQILDCTTQINNLRAEQCSIYKQIQDIHMYTDEVHSIFVVPTNDTVVYNKNDNTVKEIDKQAVQDASAYTNVFKDAMTQTMSAITGIKTKKE